MNQQHHTNTNTYEDIRLPSLSTHISPMTTIIPLSCNSLTLYLVVCKTFILVYPHGDYCKSVQYNGWFLPDIMLLTLCYQHWGNQLYPIESFCLLYSQFSHLNVLTFSPLLDVLILDSIVLILITRFRCLQIFPVN